MLFFSFDIFIFIRRVFLSKSHIHKTLLQVQQLFYQRDNISNFANKHFELLLLSVWIKKKNLLAFLPCGCSSFSIWSSRLLSSRLYQFSPFQRFSAVRRALVFIVRSLPIHFISFSVSNQFLHLCWFISEVYKAPARTLDFNQFCPSSHSFLFHSLRFILRSYVNGGWWWKCVERIRSVLEYRKTLFYGLI